jgi:hypothetical protein
MGGGSPAETAAMDAARRHIATMETALRGANGAATGANGATGGSSPAPSTNARGAPAVRSSFHLTFASGGARVDAAGRESRPGEVPAGSSAASSAAPAGGARDSGHAGPEGAAEHIRLADLD